MTCCVNGMSAIRQGRSLCAATSVGDPEEADKTPGVCQGRRRSKVRRRASLEECLLHRAGAVQSGCRPWGGPSILTKVNDQPESRMRRPARLVRREGNPRPIGLPSPYRTNPIKPHYLLFVFAESPFRSFFSDLNQTASSTIPSSLEIQILFRGCS